MADIQRGGINAGMITNTNVSYTKPTANQVLKYNATTDEWEPGADATSTDATSVQGVDICTTTPTDGQVLTYDLAATEWCPADSGGGGKIIQVVSSSQQFSWSMPNNWQGTGAYISITPTSDSNKIIGWGSVPCIAGDEIFEYNLNLYRKTSSMASGDSPSGGTEIFSTSVWPGGVRVDAHTSGVSSSQIQNFLPIHFDDTTYGTTSQIYYNLIGRHINNSWPASIINSPWDWILMEGDES